MTFFLHRSPSGKTGPQKAYWENFSMMMTPLDYWKSGMDLWLRTAEAQMDMTFRMVSLMPSWEVGLLTARGLADDRVSLRPSKDGKPVLRSVVGTSTLAAPRKPVLMPVESPVATAPASEIPAPAADVQVEPVLAVRAEWPSEPVVEAMTEATSEIRAAVAGAAEAQVEAAAGIHAAMAEMVEAQIEAQVEAAADLADAVMPLVAPVRTRRAVRSKPAKAEAVSPTEAVAAAVDEVQAAVAEAAGAQMEAAAKIADAIGEVVGVQAESATIATAQVMDITGTAAEEVLAAMAETAAPFLTDLGEVEPFAAGLPEPVAEPVADPMIEADPDSLAQTAVEPAPAPKAARTRRLAAAAVADEALPSRKRRQPAKPKLPSALKGGDQSA